MGEAKIVITCDGENIDIEWSDEGATAEELLAIHCCFVRTLIINVTEKGMKVAEIAKAIELSDKDAIEMHLRDMLK